MFCPSCGTQNPDDAGFCAKCGKKLQADGSTPPPVSRAPVSTTAGSIQNYLIWAIAATVLCCPPVGIAAIVFSAQVNSKLAAGDLAGAQKASKTAMILCIVAAAVGLVGWLIFVLLGGLAALSGSTYGGYPGT